MAKVRSNGDHMDDDKDRKRLDTKGEEKMTLSIGTSSGGGGRTSVPKVMPLAKFKLVFLGDQAVGKTSIISYFTKGALDSGDYQVRRVSFFYIRIS